MSLAACNLMSRLVSPLYFVHSSPYASVTSSYVASSDTPIMRRAACASSDGPWYLSFFPPPPKLGSAIMLGATTAIWRGCMRRSEGVGAWREKLPADGASTSSRAPPSAVDFIICARPRG
jgi:hypothetical protein